MNEKILEKLRERLQTEFTMYKEELSGYDYEKAIARMRQEHRNYTTMIMEMFYYDIISLEDWQILYEQGDNIYWEFVDKLITLSVERELKLL